ncbi:hypothetical protein MXB_2199, partial [Myxobolus squamalis]
CYIIIKNRLEINEILKEDPSGKIHDTYHALFGILNFIKRIEKIYFNRYIHIILFISSINLTLDCNQKSGYLFLVSSYIMNKIHQNCTCFQNILANIRKYPINFNNLYPYFFKIPEFYDEIIKFNNFDILYTIEIIETCLNESPRLFDWNIISRFLDNIDDGFLRKILIFVIRLNLTTSANTEIVIRIGEKAKEYINKGLDNSKYIDLNKCVLPTKILNRISNLSKNTHEIICYFDQYLHNFNIFGLYHFCLYYLTCANLPNKSPELICNQFMSKLEQIGFNANFNYENMHCIACSYLEALYDSLEFIIIICFPTILSSENAGFVQRCILILKKTITICESSFDKFLISEITTNVLEYTKETVYSKHGQIFSSELSFISVCALKILIINNKTKIHDWISRVLFGSFICPKFVVDFWSLFLDDINLKEFVVTSSLRTKLISYWVDSAFEYQHDFYSQLSTSISTIFLFPFLIEELSVPSTPLILIFIERLKTYYDNCAIEQRVDIGISNMCTTGRNATE